MSTETMSSRERIMAALKGEDVDRITVGDGDQQPGRLDTGFLEHAAAGPVPDDGEAVDRALELGGLGLVGLDDDDVLPFERQPLGEVRPDGPGSHDDDAHRSRQGSARPLVPRRRDGGWDGDPLQSH